MKAKITFDGGGVSPVIITAHNHFDLWVQAFNLIKTQRHNAGVNRIDVWTADHSGSFNRILFQLHGNFLDLLTDDEFHN